MIRLIVSDLDDTLLRSDATVSERTVRVLAEARRRGAIVVLASGRMTRAMLRYARELQITAPLIAYNGAEVVDPVSGKVAFSLPIKASLARRACALAEERGLYIQAYMGGEYYFEKETERSRRYAQAVGVEGKPVGEKLSEFIREDVVKLLLIDEPARIKILRPELEAALGGALSLTISRPNYLEFTDIAATKHAALQKLVEMMGIAPDEIAAFGDGQNDLGMLRYARLGFVPQNARPEVLAQAPALMPGNDEDGVAQVVERLIGEGLIGGDAM